MNVKRDCSRVGCEPSINVGAPFYLLRKKFFFSPFTTVNHFNVDLRHIIAKQFSILMRSTLLFLFPMGCVSFLSNRMWCRGFTPNANCRVPCDSLLAGKACYFRVKWKNLRARSSYSHHLLRVRICRRVCIDFVCNSFPVAQR